MRILFIQTGGTIDKEYPKNIKGYAFEIGEPAVKRILEKINPVFEYEIVTLFRKDSQEITDDDRQKIFELCSNSAHDKIIITHGTDTIIETAKYLSQAVNKTIVLTGAFKPERFKDSDAEFNIGTAIGAIQFLKNGVYIAMNGEVLPHDNVIRNIEDGRFLKNKQ
ncbi:MAG: asparaginase domain-containing protein [Ignavibacteria bacterium]|nr:asparaginase domain-containing protein [Ignavibacteria bacterium]